MTTEREQDTEATVQMPRPTPVVPEEIENVDPEKTLVRDDWESTAIRRVAPRIAQLKDEEVEGDAFGWESEGLRRLSRRLNAQ